MELPNPNSRIITGLDMNRLLTECNMNYNINAELLWIYDITKKKELYKQFVGNAGLIHNNMNKKKYANLLFTNLQVMDIFFKECVMRLEFLKIGHDDEDLKLKAKEIKEHYEEGLSIFVSGTEEELTQWFEKHTKREAYGNPKKGKIKEAKAR